MTFSETVKVEWRPSSAGIATTGSRSTTSLAAAHRRDSNYRQETVRKLAHQASDPLLGRVIRESIGPLAEEGLDVALGLAVGLRSIRSRAQMPQRERSTNLGEGPGDVAGAMVGHHALDWDAHLLKSSDRSA